MVLTPWEVESLDRRLHPGPGRPATSLANQRRRLFWHGRASRGRLPVATVATWRGSRWYRPAPSTTSSRQAAFFWRRWSDDRAAIAYAARGPASWSTTRAVGCATRGRARDGSCEGGLPGAAASRSDRRPAAAGGGGARLALVGPTRPAGGSGPAGTGDGRVRLSDPPGARTLAERAAMRRRCEGADGVPTGDARNRLREAARELPGLTEECGPAPLLPALPDPAPCGTAADGDPETIRPRHASGRCGRCAVVADRCTGHARRRG